jgi:hypothetical protein
MKIYFTLFLSIIFHNKCLSQFDDSTSHYFNYAGSGNLNSTEKNRILVFNNILRFSIRKKHLVLNSHNSWLYGKQRENLLSNDFSSALDFNLYTASEGFNYWGLATFDKSFSLQIINRYQVGLGAAYNIWQKEAFTFNISDGIIYEQSNVRLNDSTNKFDKTLRNSLRVRHKMSWNGRLALEGTHYVQNSLSTKKDYIIKSNTTLLVTIRKGLHITASLLYNRLNVTNRENLVSTFGISMERYW